MFQGKWLNTFMAEKVTRFLREVNFTYGWCNWCLPLVVKSCHDELVLKLSELLNTKIINKKNRDALYRRNIPEDRGTRVCFFPLVAVDWLCLLPLNRRRHYGIVWCCPGISSGCFLDNDRIYLATNCAVPGGSCVLLAGWLHLVCEYRRS